MVFFPIIWFTSILSYVFFVVKVNKIEAEYKIAVDRYPWNNRPKVKSIKSLMRHTNNRRLKRDLQLLIFLDYFSTILFFFPFVIYFIKGIFFNTNPI